jgi:hypothetical protein
MTNKAGPIKARLVVGGVETVRGYRVGGQGKNLYGRRAVHQLSRPIVGVCTETHHKVAVPVLSNKKNACSISGFLEIKTGVELHLYVAFTITMEMVEDASEGQRGFTRTICVSTKPKTMLQLGFVNTLDDGPGWQVIGFKCPNFFNKKRMKGL